MRWILFLLSAPVLLYGVAEFAGAETVWQQILAGMVGLTAVMLFCAAGVIDAIVTLQKKIESISKSAKNEK